MKKLLFLIHTLGGGGAERVLVNLVNNMDPTQFDVTVMTVVDTGIYKQELAPFIHYCSIIPLHSKSTANKNDSGSLLGHATKIKTLGVKMYTFFWRHAPLKLIHKVFIGDKYDVEVAFLEGICAKIIANSCNKNSRKFAWIHVDMVNQHKSKNVFTSEQQERMIYDKFDKIVCVSDYVKDQFYKLLNVEKSKLIVKYNAINANQIISLASEEFISNNKFTICSVGRLNKQKNYMRLAKCAYKLHSDGYDINTIVIGEGTGREELSEYITKHNMSSYFKLLGFHSNPYPYVKNADLFVCSSDAEGYSTAVVEALILGTPVVTTDCAGMSEILGNTGSGIITKKTVDSLCNGIETLLNDKELYHKTKENAIRRGQDFSLEKSVREIVELFDEYK